MILAFLFWMGHQEEYDYCIPCVSDVYAWALVVPVAQLWKEMRITEEDWFCLREQLWAMKKGFV